MSYDGGAWRRGLRRWCPWRVGIALAASAAQFALLSCGWAQEPRPAGVTLKLQGATAAQALAALSKAGDVGLVASGGGLPDDRRDFAVEGLGLTDAVAALADAYQLECVTWRGLLVAPGRRAEGTLAEGLASVLSDEERAVLLRGEDGGTFRAEGWPLLCEAVLALAGQAPQVDRYQAALRAGYWMTAPGLGQIVRAHATAENGTMLVRVVSREPTDEDPCTEHLLLVAPALNAAAPGGALRAYYHAPDYDQFAHALAKQKGLIPLEEFVRRLIAAAREREDPLADDASLNKAVEFEGTGPLRTILDGLSNASGLHLSAEDRLGNVSVVVASTTTPLRDVLTALSHVAGGALVREQGPGSYGIVPAVLVIERFLNVLPPLAWSVASSTTVERDVAQQDLVRKVWDSLDADSLGRLREQPLRLSSLPQAAQGSLRALAEFALARDFARWLRNLPLRDGPVPLWLYEGEQERFYELRSPGCSEFIQGISYLQLKMRLTGQEAITVAPAE